MRAKEFVNEDKNNLPPNAKTAMNRMVVMPDMDMFYEYYRFMNMTAGEPEEKIPATGMLRDVPVSLPYTEAEMVMINNAAKRMGRRVIDISKKGSEAKETNTSSPVASIKRNKHGV